jgi:hypothetical protein
MEKYDIPNGLLGMKRDINIKLSSYLVDYKKRVFFGVSSEYFLWKDHFLYKKLNKFPFIKINYGKVNKYLPNLLISDSIYSILEFKERLPLNSGKYILKLLPTVLNHINIVISEGVIRFGDLIYSSKRSFQMNLRCSNNNFFDDSLIEIQFDNNEKLETFIGAFKRDDLIRIEVDTNNKTIQCFINKNEIKCCKYYLVKPLVLEIKLKKNDMIKIEFFRHFNNF